ncbi:uncharacterized protein G2W53_029134 [Senna tora]|uniref:Uncharacterized protein n=1 Tax=Senna tora TaxID=362788 RepID=A0A834W9D3_9FABA|nr:uncharacterized protein G2W53_029134 [Senna tora]
MARYGNVHRCSVRCAEQWWRATQNHALFATARLVASNSEKLVAHLEVAMSPRTLVYSPWQTQAASCPGQLNTTYKLQKCYSQEQRPRKHGIHRKIETRGDWKTYRQREVMREERNACRHRRRQLGTLETTACTPEMTPWHTGDETQAVANPNLSFCLMWVRLRIRGFLGTKFTHG